MADHVDHLPERLHIEEERWRGVFSGKSFVIYHIRSDTELIAKVFRRKEDATLLAASPELYEALEDLISCAEVYDEFNDPNHDYYVVMHEAQMALCQVDHE